MTVPPRAAGRLDIAETSLEHWPKAVCAPSYAYGRHKLTGIRHGAVSEASGIYELSPIHGEPKHASQENLANVEVWQKLV